MISVSHTHHHRRLRFLILAVLLGALLISVAGCGKRGDPYRPSDAPSASDNRY